MTPNEPPRTVTVVVATLGRSALLGDALRAIKAQRTTANIRLVVVSQGAQDQRLTALIDGLADRHLESREPLGFAAANNLALKEILRGESGPAFVALINDDAIVADDWLSRLLALLEANPQLAAAQGLNRVYSDSRDSTLIDGAGIRWNRRLQAVQIDHGEDLGAGTRDSNPHGVFGVSATAALWRTTALQAVARATATPFDVALDTYYEDVDLACRLRSAGFEAMCDPSAVCWHVGSSSAPANRQRLLIANRHLVLARHLGRGYWWCAPALALRDLIDFGVAAIPGWARLLRLLPTFIEWHAPHPLVLEEP